MFTKILYFSHTDNCWFQVNENRPRNVLARSSLTEKGVERIVSTADTFVTGHLTVGLDSMLQTV